MAKKKAARRAAKKPAKKAAKKTGKKGSTRAATQTGESKKPYPAARFTADNLGLHNGVVASELNPTPRDYSDREKLQKLYAMGVALQHWASRFEGYAVTAIAAGGMDFLALQRLLRYVGEQVENLAPELTASENIGNTAVAGARNLDAAVFVATHLPAVIYHMPYARCIPMSPYADGNNLEREPLDMEWEPPENDLGASLADRLKEPVAAALSLASWWEHFPSITKRVAALATAAVRSLDEHVNSDGKGGFSWQQVDARVQSMPPESPARRTHKEFTTALATLASMANRSDTGQWADWEQLTQQVQQTYSDWCDTCFAPTVTGKSAHARSKRQSKKELLRRLVATVTQYGKLLRGAAEMSRVTAAIESLGFLGQRLEQATRKVWTDVAQPNAREVGQLVRTLDEKAVADRKREVWIRSLGPMADACGRLAEIIAGYEQYQEDPWEPKEHLAKLEDAGIFKRSKHDDEFTEIRIRMQGAGIAVQGPWKFIEGKRAEPETKKGLADKWLLNPMAQILAQHPD